MSAYRAKHARRATRRGTAAVGALAATAALTIAGPGISNAATSTAAVAPAQQAAATETLPGTAVIAVIAATSPALNNAAATWNAIPVVSSLVKVGNTTTTIDKYGTAWTGVGAQNVLTIKGGAAQFAGLGLTNTTYGVIGNTAGGVGSIGGNKVVVDVLGGSVFADASLSSVTDTAGNTTWTPSLGLGGTAPFGLGSATATIVPVVVTQGDDTFIVGLPKVNLGLTGPLGIKAGLGFDIGSIGFQNGNLVIVLPKFNADFDSNFGGANLALTGGTISIGLDGFNFTGPTLDAGVTVRNPLAEGTPVLVDAGLNLEGGSVNVGTDGIAVSGPSGNVDVTAPGVGGVNVGVDTGSAEVDFKGGSANVTGPSGSATVSDKDGNKTGVEASTGAVDVDKDGVVVTPPSVTPVNEPVAPTTPGPVADEVEAPATTQETTSPAADASASVDSSTTETAPSAA